MTATHQPDLGTRATTGRRLNRRQVLQALGLGGAGAIGLGASGLGASGILSTAGVAARQDLTVAPPTEEATLPPPSLPTVGDKAAELQYDLERIFRFVADEVQYDAYAGALRGAKGTLWGLAGNSVDQALLLAALLREAVFTVRFAVGELDGDRVDSLRRALSLDELALRSRQERLATGDLANQDAPAADAFADADPAVAEFQQSLPERRAQLLETATAQLSESVALIAGALAAEGISLPETPADIPEREIRQHVWVQYADGPLWVDLDPTLPGAELGKALTQPVETMDELPDDLYHRVAFRLSGEVVRGGSPARQDLLVHEVRCVDLAGTPPILVHVTPEAVEGFGLAIAGSLEGTVQFVPRLVVGEEVVQEQARVTFVTGEGMADFLGDIGGRQDGDAPAGWVEGDTLAEWLEIELRAPDGETSRFEREIFDRVGRERRAAGEVDPDAVPPVELIEDPELGMLYPPLLSVSSIAVVGFALPATVVAAAADAIEGGDLLSGLVATNHAFQIVRDQLHVETVGLHGQRLFADTPNVTIVTMSPADPVGDTGQLRLEFDVVSRRFATVPVPVTVPSLPAPIAVGVLSHVAERAAVEGALSLLGDDASERAVGVGRLFEEAARQGIGLSVLTPNQVDLGPIGQSHSGRAGALIAEALAAGAVVIVPEQPVVLNGAPLSGWWLVDPVTGATRDQMENGRGSEVVEKTILFQLVELYITVKKVVMCALGAALAGGALMAVFLGRWDDAKKWGAMSLMGAGSCFVLGYAH